MEKIDDFIIRNKENMSFRLFCVLRMITKKYTYMNELSVLNLYRTRNVGVKPILELLKIYPELKNEVGFICVENLNYWIKKGVSLKS